MINEVTLLGRLGQDWELKYTAGGKAIATTSLATTKTFKKDGEKVEQSEWHSLEIWDKAAEIVAQYSKKGSLLFVKGELKTSTWEKEGVKRQKTSIVVNNFKFLDSKKGVMPKPAHADVTTDEIPF